MQTGKAAVTAFLLIVLCLIMAATGLAFSGQVNINSASEKELDTLPSIGPGRAREIVEYRRSHGRFHSLEELLKVDDIGPAILNVIRPHITLDGPAFIIDGKAPDSAPQAADGTAGQKGLEHDILRIVPTQPGDIRLLADGDFYPLLAQAIRQARERIDIAMFLFKITDSSANMPAMLVDELANARKRGVAVRVVLERSDRDASLNRENGGTAKELKRHGIEVRFDSPVRTTHTKIVVIDNRVCFVGSHNLTHAALAYNHELTLMIDSTLLAADLLQYLSTIH